MTVEMMITKMMSRSTFTLVLLALLQTFNHSFAQSLNNALWLPGDRAGTDNNVALPSFRPSLSQFNDVNYQFTLEAWIYPQTPSSSSSANNTFNDYGSILYARNGTYASGMFIRTSQSVAYELRSSWANQSTVSTQSTGFSVEFNTWHHVAFAINSTTHIIYLDGRAYVYPAGPRYPELFLAGSYIGWDPATATRTYRGYIDELRMWNVMRTPEQLAATRYQPLAGNETGLFAYYNFDVNANDLTTNGYHGVMSNKAQLLPSTVFYPRRMDTTSPITSQSASTASPIFTYVKAGSKLNPLTRLSFTTLNGLAPSLNLTELRVNLTGTTNIADIQAINVYYTASSWDFHGSAMITSMIVSNATNTNNIVMPVNLVLDSRVHYVWLTADIASTARVGNQIFATVTSIKVGDSNYPVTPINASVTYIDVQPTLVVSDPTWFAPLNSSKHEVASTFAPSNIEAANFVAFQQDAITTMGRFQYLTYWNLRYHVVVSRREIIDLATALFGPWNDVEFYDYTITSTRYADNHYSISLGVCESDGSIHIAYDMHGDALNYRKSVAGLSAVPVGSPLWSNTSFEENRDWLVAGEPLGQVTYPRFFPRPDRHMQFEWRFGTSGAGDNHLHLYNGTTGNWTFVGKYAQGLNLSPTQNAYMSRIEYDHNGRMHVSWIWRETPDPLTNHDCYYGYSDDQGYTWKNADGQVVAQSNTNPMSLETPGLKILTIGTKRGLINQESQAVDSHGRLHMLISYLLPQRPNSTNFWNDRTASIIPGSGAMLQHVYQLPNGTWASQVIGSATRNRAQIAVDANDNLYLVAPNQRVFFASNTTNYAIWTVLDYSQANEGINEPQIDRALLVKNNVLSFTYSTLAQSIKVSTYTAVRIAPAVTNSSSTGTNMFSSSAAIIRSSSTGTSISYPVGTVRIIITGPLNMNMTAFAVDMSKFIASINNITWTNVFPFIVMEQSYTPAMSSPRRLLQATQIYPYLIRGDINTVARNSTALTAANAVSVAISSGSFNATESGVDARNLEVTSINPVNSSDDDGDGANAAASVSSLLSLVLITLTVLFSL